MFRIKMVGGWVDVIVKKDSSPPITVSGGERECELGLGCLLVCCYGMSPSEATSSCDFCFQILLVIIGKCLIYSFIFLPIFVASHHLL